MRLIKLGALNREAPRCTDFADEQAVREFERAMRAHRALSEPWSVLVPDGGLSGTFQVKGGGGAYRVDIVDGTGEADSCTCEDFFTSDLGACKHLEAVRRAIEGNRQLRAQAKALGPHPAVPTIAVEAVSGLRLLARGRFTKAMLRKAGLALCEDGGVEPQRTSALDGADGSYRVTAAARVAWERISARRELSQRRERVERLFADKKLGVDVLSEPLFAYQRDGVSHLASAGRAMLADDMGLGKTVQAIAACEVLCARGEADRVLIVTPASLKHQWAREIERYTGQRAVVVGGGSGARRAALSSSARYKILNYELTWRELEQLQALDADVLVLDEAQRAKNFRTKTAVTLRSIPSRFLFVLTGTPVENRLDDLYSLMQLVDPALLAPLWRFNLRFHDQAKSGKITGYKNLSALRAEVSKVVLRRRKEEVLSQLPALTKQTRYVPLTAEQARLELDLRQGAGRLLAMAERRALTRAEQERLMALLLKARQACDAVELCEPKNRHPGSPKLDELENIIEEICEQGTQKVLVFSEWVEMLKLAAARLDKMGVGYRMLHGGVATERRPSLLRDFEQSPDVRVLLSSDAGGVGLNLQVASYIVHLDLPWNPARLDQRVARAHRLGQTRGVSVVHLVAEHGIERGIEATLSTKRAVRDASLEPESDVDAIAAPSFTAFLREVREVLADDAHLVPSAGQSDGAPPETAALPSLDVAEEPVSAISVVQPTAQPETAKSVVPQVASQAVSQSTLEQALAQASQSPAGPATQRAIHGGVEQPRAGRAGERLRLSRVVLGAGFAADAVRAAYEALAAAIAARLDGDLAARASRDHATLVAAIFKELLPVGRLPHAAHGALARLHDLASLERMGVEVDLQLAEGAVREAEEWVERLAAEISR